MVAQHAPLAPAATNRRAISGDLCDFACGLIASPLDLAKALITAIFLSSVSHSNMSEGVATLSRRIPRLVIDPSPCATGFVLAVSLHRRGIQLPAVLGFRQARSNGKRQALGAISW